MRVNEISNIAGHKLKTTGTETLKSSVELMGTAESGDDSPLVFHYGVFHLIHCSYVNMHCGQL